MGRPSYRDKLVASGMDTVHRRGFAMAGVREITAEAGVAQGSFTNHFASKEEFGVAILDRYFDGTLEIIARTVGDESRKPRERLLAYFDTITELLESVEWRYGCLVGNMSLEAAEHSELIRERLGEIYAGLTPPFSAVIREGQLTGEIRPDLDADEAGSALLEAWHGAMLRMKIERSPAPLNRFKRLILPSLLGEERIS